MAPSRFRLGLALFTCAAFLALAGSPVLAQTPPDVPTEIDFETGQRIDSSVCATCHVDIHESWQRSVHAESYREPVFQAGLAQAIADSGAEVAETCLTCHSPATILLDRARPDQAMEGVNCQICHAIKAPRIGEFPPYELDRELRVYGPRTDAESPVHQTAYSEFMGSAEYCATCHEYTGPAGAAVLSTFTEFESGSYPPLTACQGCHMPLVPGRSVRADVKETGRGEFVGSHLMPGGRDVNQLRRSVAVDVVSVDETSGGVDVEVMVRNNAAGHFLPTGMPSRRMVLEVSTRFDQEIHSRSFVFGRRVIDADGQPLERVGDMVLYGARVIADSRLRPRQERNFNYTLPAPTGVPTTLVVRLYYESTELPDTPPVTEDVVRIERAVN